MKQAYKRNESRDSIFSNKLFYTFTLQTVDTCDRIGASAGRDGKSDTFLAAWLEALSNNKSCGYSSLRSIDHVQSIVGVVAQKSH